MRNECIFSVVFGTTWLSLHQQLGESWWTREGCIKWSLFWKIVRLGTVESYSRVFLQVEESPCRTWCNQTTFLPITSTLPGMIRLGLWPRSPVVCEWSEIMQSNFMWASVYTRTLHPGPKLNINFKNSASILFHIDVFHLGTHNLHVHFLTTSSPFSHNSSKYQWRKKKRRNLSHI